MRCHSCNSGAVFHDSNRGEFVCTSCGLVILDRILVSGPEWRTKGGEGPERADVSSGVDFTLHDLGMGTDFRASTNASPVLRARLRRMKNLQKRSRAGSWQERSLREALIELDKICEDMSIPKGIKTEACVVYRKAKSKGLTAGRNFRQVLGAVIFLTCRMRGIPRTENEVAEVFFGRYGFEKNKFLKNIRKISRILKKELGLEVRRISVGEYIDKFSTMLGISREAVERAHLLADKSAGKFNRPKSPLFLAAIFVYLGAKEAGEKLTLKMVAESFGIGVSSLSQNTSRFEELLRET